MNINGAKYKTWPHFEFKLQTLVYQQSSYLLLTITAVSYLAKLAGQPPPEAGASPSDYHLCKEQHGISILDGPGLAGSHANFSGPSLKNRCL